VSMPFSGESHITTQWYLSKIFPTSMPRSKVSKQNPENVGISRKRIAN